MSAGQSSLKFLIFGQDVSGSKAIKGVGTQADQTGTKLQNAGKHSGNLAKVAGFAGAAVAGLGIAGLKTGIQTAAGLQQAQIGFSTLLGSSQKAGAYIKDLQKFAAATPFEFKGLVDSSRLLLGVGVSAKDVIPTLTDFGDAAGALGIQQDAFQRIMLATSQAISAGKFQVGDINQLVNNGLPAWKLLSDATGKPVIKLRELASHGKLLAKDVLPVLRKEMHKDYGGAMSKQSQTLSGLWSTLSDTLTQGLAQAIQPLIPVLQQNMPGAINAASSAIKGMGAVLAVVIPAVVELAGYIQAHWRVFAVLAGVILSLMAAWKAWNVVVKVSTVLLKLQTAGTVENAIATKVAAAAAKAWTLAQAALNAVMDANPIALVVLAVAALAAGFVIAYKHSETFRNIVKATFSAVGDAGKAMWDVLKAVFHWVANAFLDVVGVIIHGAADAFGWVPGIGGKLKAAAKHFDDFRDSVNNSLNGIIPAKTITVTAHYKAVGLHGAVYDSQVPDYKGSTGSGKKHHAVGGIIMRRMVTNTGDVFGEAGPEAVVPLSAGRGGAGLGGPTFVLLRVEMPVGTADYPRAGREIAKALSAAQESGFVGALPVTVRG